MIRLYAGQSMPDQARAMLTEMQAQGMVPDNVAYNMVLAVCSNAQETTEVTFGTLLKVCTRAGDLIRAREVLAMMGEAGVPKNNIVYTSMIKGLAAVGQLKEAMQVFDELRADANLRPDVICYSVLIKGHCDQGQLETALSLLEGLLEAGHAPDEILFNNLLAGCAQQPHVQLGEKLLADMVKHQIQPTMA